MFGHIQYAILDLLHMYYNSILGQVVGLHFYIENPFKMNNRKAKSVEKVLFMHSYEKWTKIRDLMELKINLA